MFQAKYGEINAKDMSIKDTFVHHFNVASLGLEIAHQEPLLNQPPPPHG